MENENDLKVIELGSGLGSLLASISILIIINTQAIAVHTIAPIAIGLYIKKKVFIDHKKQRGRLERSLELNREVLCEENRFITNYLLVFQANMVQEEQPQQ
jgi:hypothetical protein